MLKNILRCKFLKFYYHKLDTWLVYLHNLGLNFCFSILGRNPSVENQGNKYWFFSPGAIANERNVSGNKWDTIQPEEHEKTSLQSSFGKFFEEALCQNYLT